MAFIQDIFRSYATKLGLLLVIFLLVPYMIYGQFEEANEDKRMLLLRTVQEQGRLIAQSIARELQAIKPEAIPDLNARLAGFGDESLKVKLLFRPAEASADTDFFFVASSPRLSNEHRDQEQAELIRSGTLDKLEDSCVTDRSLAVRYTNPAGEEEILTSITSVQTKSGCWVLITSHPATTFAGITLDEPYWSTPEVRLAATIYGVMALLVIALFLGNWRNLGRFQRQARRIRTGGSSGSSFSSLNRIPELKDVAEDFDRMVRTLRDGAEAIRRTAEENAHSFKTPIGIIMQSLEPLKRALPHDDRRARRSLEIIEKAVGRLDGLVTAARRIDETTAELVSPARQEIHLTSLLARVTRSYADILQSSDVRLMLQVQDDIVVRGSEPLIKAAIENVLENAISFSPERSSVAVTLRRRRHDAEILIEDEGPGVRPGNLERIFEQYYSDRPVVTQEAVGAAPAPPANFGIGLWVVRRNVDAHGGTAHAENRPEGGLRVVLSLPAAT